jgi:hypothetical protein
MPDGASPLDQGEGVPGEPIELLRIALASRILQRIDSCAAKLCRVFWFLGTIRAGHHS